jgi:hypothetical protein
MPRGWSAPWRICFRTRKFGPAGSVARVTLRQRTARLEVTNAAPELEAQLPRLFDWPYRARRTRATDGQLPIARHRARARGHLDAALADGR